MQVWVELYRNGEEREEREREELSLHHVGTEDSCKTVWKKKPLLS